MFLIFDRKTESLWYPLDDTKWTAISGSRKGESIPFIAEPPIVPLGEWRKKHPDTLVLLGDKSWYAPAGENNRPDPKRAAGD